MFFKSLMLSIFHADVQSSSRWVFETLGPNWTKIGNTYFLFFQSFETYSQYWLAEHRKIALYLKGTDMNPCQSPVPPSHVTQGSKQRPRRLWRAVIRKEWRWGGWHCRDVTHHNHTWELYGPGFGHIVAWGPRTTYSLSSDHQVQVSPPPSTSHSVCQC